MAALRRCTVQLLPMWCGSWFPPSVSIQFFSPKNRGTAVAINLFLLFTLRTVLLATILRQLCFERFWKIGFSIGKERKTYKPLIGTLDMLTQSGSLQRVVKQYLSFHTKGIRKALVSNGFLLLLVRHLLLVAMHLFLIANIVTTINKRSFFGKCSVLPFVGPTTFLSVFLRQAATRHACASTHIPLKSPHSSESQDPIL